MYWVIELFLSQAINSIGLFQTLEYHEWIVEGVKLDFMTCVYVSLSSSDWYS